MLLKFLVYVVLIYLSCYWVFINTHILIFFLLNITSIYILLRLKIVTTLPSIFLLNYYWGLSITLLISVGFAVSNYPGLFWCIVFFFKKNLVSLNNILLL